MKFNPLSNHRVLVIDDNRAIHEELRKILTRASSFLRYHEAALFGGTPRKFPEQTFEVDSAYQGQQGLDLIEKSLIENRPYALAFVDVRMPPGWDGVETTCKIWEKYPGLQVVICSAFSDYSWEEMVSKLGYWDRVVILKKPFDNIEVLQLAIAMTEIWRHNQQTKFRVDNLEQLIKSTLRNHEKAAAPRT